MKKSDVITQLRQQKVVAVIRGDDYETGLKTCVACIDGGLTAIEMAFSNNQADAIIKTLCEQYKDDPDVLIGAGTVLDAPTARLAILAGARYVVSPSFDQETALLCNTYGVPYIPGCMTIKEIITGMKYGSELIKLFPGNTLGISYVSAVKSPLPQVSLMVTGGVNLETAKAWFDAGVDAIGVGGELNKLAQKGDFAEVTNKARQYVSIVKESQR